jgi:hypothetical protein
LGEGLAEGTAIANELVVLARRCELVPMAAPEPLQQSAEARQRAQAAVAFLAATLAQAREASRQGPVGVFGTSIGGVWLAAQLGANAAFFVDREVSRLTQEATWIRTSL